MSLNERFLMAYTLVILVMNQYLDDWFGIGIGGNGLVEWYGYIDKNGKFAIKKKRKFVVESFSCGRAIQWIWGPSDDKCFLDTSGHQVTDWFQDALPFSENLAAVKHADRYGFINLDGEVVVPCTYDDAESFLEGMAAICSSGKWGFIDTSGKLAIEPQFNQSMYFSEGLAPVELDGKFGYINADGKFIVEPTFWEVARFSCGLALVDDSDYIDKKGRVVFSTEWKPDYHKFHSYSNFAFIYVADGHHWYNPMSESRVLRLWKPHRRNSMTRYYSTVRTFSEGLAVAGRGDKCGYIDLEGTFCIDAVFDYAYPFCGERALVYVDGLFGYINKSGQFVVRPQFERAYSFSEGHAVAVFPNGNYGYIDRDGNVAIKPRFSSAHSFSEGLAQVGSHRYSI